MKTNEPATKAIAPTKTLEEIKSHLKSCTTSMEPEYVLREADRELSGKSVGSLGPTTAESNIFKSMTLFEFENGTLLTTTMDEQYKTFGIDLMRNLQKEYDCQTSSEKATAELASANYIRTLDIQRKINSYLSKGSFTDLGVKYIDVLSRELDRANRHYLEAIHALKTMKQPHLGVNINAQTAIVGQNQMVQTNNLPNDL